MEYFKTSFKLKMNFNFCIKGNTKMNTLTIENYSEKSFVLRGNTKPYKAVAVKIFNVQRCTIDRDVNGARNIAIKRLKELGG